MKLFYKITILILVNFIFSENCDQLFEKGLYKLNKIITTDKDTFIIDPIYLKSEGKEDGSINVFKTNSFLLVGEAHYMYNVLSCHDSILLVRSLTQLGPQDEIKFKFDVVSNATIDNATKQMLDDVIISNEIPITDPLQQVQVLKTLCSQLFNKGTYNLELYDNIENSFFNYTLNIYRLPTVNYHFDSYKTYIEYDWRTKLTENKSGKNYWINSCRDNEDNSTILAQDKKYKFIIKKIESYKLEENKLSDNFCDMLSVPGNYEIYMLGEKLGKLRVLFKNLYELSVFNEYHPYFWRKLVYSSINQAVFTSQINKSLISTCANTKKNEYYLFRTDETSIQFDFVEILNQDVSEYENYLKKIKQLEKEQFRLDTPINEEEIKDLLSKMKVPIHRYQVQYCKQILFPGDYVLYGDKKEVGIENFGLVSISNLRLNKTRYVFKGRQTGSNNDITFRCLDFQGQSLLYYENEANKYNRIMDITNLKYSRINADSNWYKNKNNIISLRSENKCFELRNNTKYIVSSELFSGILDLKQIVESYFNFKSGLNRILEKSKLEIKETKAHHLKENDVDICVSNRYSSQLYLQVDKDDRGRYESNEKRNKRKFKFNMLEKIV